MEASKKSLLILSPWGNDWDLDRVEGNPESAYILRGLLRRGFTIHLLLPWDKRFAPKNRDSLFFYPVTFPSLPSIRRIGIFLEFLRYLYFNLLCIKKAGRIIQEKRISVIYGWGSYVALSTWILGRVFKKPTVIKLFGIFFPPSRFSIRGYITDFSSIIALSLSFNRFIMKDDGTQGDKAAERFKIPKRIFSFWKSPVDRSWGEMERKPQKGVILAVGNLVWFKGFDLAIKAMVKIIEKEPSTRLLIIGGGPERKRLEELIIKLGLRESVSLLGAKRHKEILKYYKIADIMVATNKVSNLTKPVEEAMICGIPVVATNIRDTFKIIKDGETGLLAEEDPEDIARKVLSLLRNRGLYKRISKNAKRFALSHFPSWEERIREEAELISSLCQ